MIIEHGGLKLGQMVLFNDPDKGWKPAVVETIYPTAEGKKPGIALVVFVTGFHMPSRSVNRAEHGKGKSEWLLYSELATFLGQEDGLLSDAEKAQKEALKKAEEAARAALAEAMGEEPKTEEKVEEKKPAKAAK